MKRVWKNTAILTLMLIGIMQFVPFIPNHNSCQAACCTTEVSCCETGMDSGCDMAMTSCSVIMFIPLISAPLIKVESNIQLDMAFAPELEIDVISTQQNLIVSESFALREATPPDQTPLLI